MQSMGKSLYVIYFVDTISALSSYLIRNLFGDKAGKIYQFIVNTEDSTLAVVIPASGTLSKPGRIYAFTF